MPRLTFENKVTLSGAIQIILLLISLIGGGFTLFSRVDANDKDISALQRVVTDIPGIKSDVLLLQNTISNRSSARDAQISSVTGQVSTLSSRVDRIETSVDTKLDDIAKSLTSIQTDVAALKATSGALNR